MFLLVVLLGSIAWGCCAGCGCDCGCSAGCAGFRGIKHFFSFAAPIPLYSLTPNRALSLSLCAHFRSAGVLAMVTYR